MPIQTFKQVATTYINEKSPPKKDLVFTVLLFKTIFNQIYILECADQGLYEHEVMIEQIGEASDVMEIVDEKGLLTPGVNRCTIELHYFECNHPLDPVEIDCQIIIKELDYMLPLHPAPIIVTVKRGMCTEVVCSDSRIKIVVEKATI